MQRHLLTLVLVGVVGFAGVAVGYGFGAQSEAGALITGAASPGFSHYAEVSKGVGGASLGGALRAAATTERSSSPAGAGTTASRSAVAQASVFDSVVKKSEKESTALFKVGASTTTSTIVYAERILPAAEQPPAEECHFVAGQFPKYRPLFISEVAWAGTPEDSGNEWIELRNASSGPINAGGYWLLDKAEQIKVRLPAVLIPPEGFYLLERGDDAVPDIEADAVYTGGLANSNEELRLFDPWCNLLDEVIAGPKWPAGDSTAKRSMERGGNWDWFSYQGAAVSGILGTPKRENSAPKAPNTQSAPALATVAPAAEGGTQSSSSTAQSGEAQQEEVATSTGEAPVTPPAAAATKLVVSRIQITGGSGKTTEDFVEFYNPSAEIFNLKGYRLVKRTKTGAADTSLKSWTEDAFVAGGGMYRWANTSYPGAADMRTSGSIADDNAVALRKGAADTGEIIDAVGWGEAANALVEGSPFAINPKVNEFLVRMNNADTDNNATDFKIE